MNLHRAITNAVTNYAEQLETMLTVINAAMYVDVTSVRDVCVFALEMTLQWVVAPLWMRLERTMHEVLRVAQQ